MIDAATLRSWSGEIETELSAARSELSYQIDRARDAEELAAVARSDQQSTQLQINALRRPAAFSLVARLHALGDRAGAAAGEAVMLRNNVALVREKIADLEEAAQQVAELLAALTTEAEEPAHAT